MYMCVQIIIYAMLVTFSITVYVTNDHLGSPSQVSSPVCSTCCWSCPYTCRQPGSMLPSILAAWLVTFCGMWCTCDPGL